ncbi:hypothetical protein [Saccharothrix xinjiangensis]|uniref:Uncharacterized protein n=1 Tax=Saccharothrix xinjiangensis TaxID=204798 RepID=A0ABV9XWN4_9PSEU
MRIAFTRVERIGDQWHAHRETTYGTGITEHGVHVFPVDILEWRAAEYGFDPADIDTLLDIVLCEPYLTAQDWAMGAGLIDAPDIATARRDHVARCAAAKLRNRISTRPGTTTGFSGSATTAGIGSGVGVGAKPTVGHPLDPVRQAPGIDVAVMAAKAEHVGLLRAIHVQVRRAQAAEVQLPRITRVRRALDLERAGLFGGPTA